MGPPLFRVVTGSSWTLQAEVAVMLGATGATDATGFGLLGHLRRMANASAVDVHIDASRVPILPGVVELAADGVLPGGSRRNLSWVRDLIDADDDVDETTLELLADAQTSGGLLSGCAPGKSERAVALLSTSGHEVAVIGSGRGGTGRIDVHGRIT